LETLREYLRDVKDRGNSPIGVVLDETDNSGWTSLHWSVFRGQFGVVQDLVREGADVNKKTKDEWTPLQLASYRNYIDSK
jgi:ankyrin repeat protein